MKLNEAAAARGVRIWRCPTCLLAARASVGLLALPNNPLVVAAIQAIAAGGEHAQLNEGGWRSDRAGAPYYDFWSGSGGRIRVRLADLNHEAAWLRVGRFSSLTLDACAALLAGIAANPFRASTCAPRREAVRLGAPMVLAAKAYDRYGAERAQFAASVDAEIASLLQMRFDILNYPAFSPKTRSWSHSGVSRSDIALFEVDLTHAPADVRDCGRSLPLRLGAWSEHWLNAAGPMWIGALPQSILALDHRRNRGADALAKKVALLLALNWGAARRQKTLKIEMRVLLRRIGELRRPSAEPLHHAGRLVDRMDEALMRLSERGIMNARLLAEEAQDLRAAGRRWFERWLESEIVFDRPAFVTPPREAANDSWAETPPSLVG